MVPLRRMRLLSSGEEGETAAREEHARSPGLGDLRGVGSVDSLVRRRRGVQDWYTNPSAVRSRAQQKLHLYSRGEKKYLLLCQLYGVLTTFRIGRGSHSTNAGGEV